MSSGKNNPRIFQVRNPLYVVRERVAERQYVLCAPENITPGRKVFAEKIRAMSGVQGAIVGAFLGERPWDVQPVVLVKGKMTLLRVSDPGISLRNSAFDDLKSYYERLCQHAKPEALIDWGIEGDQIWTHRHYYNQVLSWSEAVGPDGYARESVLGVHPLSILKDVIAAVFDLHKVGLSHGHLSRSNMTLVEGKPVLFDHGIRLLGFSTSEADEIGAFDRYSSDVFWLAQLIDYLVGRELPQEHKEFLSVMQAPSFSERPDLLEVVKVFAPELLTRQAQAPPIDGFSTSTGAPGFTQTGGAIVRKGVSEPPSGRRGKILDPGIKMMDAVPKETVATKKQPRTVKLENIVEKSEPVVRRVSVASQIPQPPNIEPIAPVEVFQQIEQAEPHQKSAPEEGPLDVAPEQKLDSPLQPARTEPPPAPAKGSDQLTGRELIPVKKSKQVEPVPSSSSSGTLFVVFVICIFAGGFLYKLGYLPEQLEEVFVSTSSEDAYLFEEYWASGQRAKMSEVARAAVVKGDKVAIRTIIDSIRQKKSGSFLNSQIVQIGFSNLWFDQLKLPDKRLLLTYSLGELVDTPPANLPRVVDAHRAVALALVVGLPQNVQQRWFEQVKVSDFSVLPAPFGRAFSLLNDLGVLTLKDRTARALARILVGNFDRQILADYFNKSDPLHISVGKLRVVEPLFDSIEGLAEALLEALAFRVAVLTQTAAWFAKDEIAGWDKVRTSEKLRLMAAMPTRGLLSIEQLADLLRYPLSTGQQLAVEQLKKRLRRRVSVDVIEFLITERCAFDRSQTVSIIIALSSKGDAAFTMIDRWFRTSPDPDSVLKVLLLRQNNQRIDAFNIEAARYLKGKELSLSFAEKKQLIQHTEILVRSLGYSSLNAGNAEELRLLRDMSRVEPSERLRRQLTVKLDIAREREELGGS